MPDSNLGPLPMKSGALPMSLHIFFSCLLFVILLSSGWRAFNHVNLSTSNCNLNLIYQFLVHNYKLGLNDFPVSAQSTTTPTSCPRSQRLLWSCSHAKFLVDNNMLSLKDSLVQCSGSHALFLFQSLCWISRPCRYQSKVSQAYCRSTYIQYTLKSCKNHFNKHSFPPL